MEESAPGPTAQDERAAREETVAQAQKPARERRRLRVPTSVLVTILLAAVSVWVAPAFTRQWEDRKQARELQAETGEQIARAAAITANRLTIARTQPEFLDVLSEWRVAQTRIGAKLRAYYGPTLRRDWEQFDEAVTSAIWASSLICCLSDPWGSLKRVKANMIAEVDGLLKAIGKVQPLLAPTLPPNVNRWRASVEAYAHIQRQELGRSYRLVGMTAKLAGLIVAMSGGVIDELMTSDPEAFSTTRRDLLRDLLP